MTDTDDTDKGYTEDGFEEGEESSPQELSLKETPALTAFLDKWDRKIPEGKRCYGTKLLLAGAESPQVRDSLYRVGVRRILVSYYYFQSQLRTKSYQELAEDLGRFDFVFLDSGGFTFMVAASEGKKMKMDVREYADRYYEEIPKFKDLFAGIAEIDVGTLGYPYMTEKKEAMLALGVPILPVIQGDPVEEYREMGWFDKYPYIAVGSGTVANLGYMNDIYRICAEKSIVLHGFGISTADVMLRSRYYSVDSTTWQDGARYGTTCIFQSGRIRYYDHHHKDVRKRYRTRFEENGILWADIEKEKGSEINIMNALSWKQWADYNQYTTSHCYWLTEAERKRATELKQKAFNTEGIIDAGASIERAKFRRLSQITDASSDDRAHEVLYCDTCHMTGRCTRYRKGQPCSFDTNVRLETKEDLQKAARLMLEAQYGRAMTSVLFEKLQGGIVDANTSREMGTFFTMMGQVRAIFTPREETLTISASGGKGVVAAALAAVFQKSGSADSGSGLTRTQIAAGKVIDVSPMEEGDGDEE